MKSSSNERSNDTQSARNKILTVPNILSFFRLCLIPVIMWLYCVEENYLWAGITLILSGITDTVDGFVARHFHMTSDLGKMLDPVADKLTQAAMLFCLLTRFPLMILPLALMVVKETFMGITGLLVIHKTGKQGNDMAALCDDGPACVLVQYPDGGVQSADRSMRGHDAGIAGSLWEE